MILKIAAFVLPLGLDTLAVSIALGLRGFRPWLPAITFAVFEGVMPIAGIILARLVGLRFETAAVVIGGFILMGIGIHAIREALECDDELEGVSFGSLRSSLLAGLAISMDELAVGFPLGASALPIPPMLIAIAAQALIVTAIGIVIGRRLTADLGSRASQFAGVAAGGIFFLVGVWLIVERFISR